MQLINFRILLVHNELNWHPITWLSLLIRMFTFGLYNHIAVEVDLYGCLTVFESTGEGVRVRPFSKWATHANRRVLPLVPMSGGMDVATFKKLLEMLNEPYGFGDLLRIAWYFINARWFGRKIAVKNGKGFICTEVGCLLLGIDWLIVPNEFQHAPGLIRGEEFETRKK